MLSIDTVYVVPAGPFGFNVRVERVENDGSACRIDCYEYIGHPRSPHDYSFSNEAGAIAFAEGVESDGCIDPVWWVRIGGLR